MINIATVFSGIGAIEWALRRMRIEHNIVFACDNGEIELNDLDENSIRETIKKLGTVKEQNEYVKNLYSKSKKTNL